MNNTRAGNKPEQFPASKCWMYVGSSKDSGGCKSHHVEQTDKKKISTVTKMLCEKGPNNKPKYFAIMMVRRANDDYNANFV